MKYLYVLFLIFIPYVANSQSYLTTYKHSDPHYKDTQIWYVHLNNGEIFNGIGEINNTYQYVKIKLDDGKIKTFHSSNIEYVCRFNVETVFNNCYIPLNISGVEWKQDIKFVKIVATGKLNIVVLSESYDKFSYYGTLYIKKRHLLYYHLNDSTIRLKNTKKQLLPMMRKEVDIDNYIKNNYKRGRVNYKDLNDVLRLVRFYNSELTK